MSKKLKLLISLCMCFLIVLVLCTNSINLNIDNVLKKYKYDVSLNGDEKFVYIFVYDNKKYTVSKFNVKNNGKIVIDVPLDKKFVVSLIAHKTIAYTWNIKNNVNNKVLSLSDKKWIDIRDNSRERSTGGSPDRQNFYFIAVSAGTESLTLQYERETSPESTIDPFTITVEVTLNK